MGTEMTQIEELANSILEKTNEGKLQWSTLGDGYYQAAIGDNSITIDARSQIYTLVIRNTEGQVVERMNVLFGTKGQKEEILSAIYRLARRQALKVDETLEEIKRTLNGL
jgi:hypothetical protein